MKQSREHRGLEPKGKRTGRARSLVSAEANGNVVKRVVVSASNLIARQREEARVRSIIQEYVVCIVMSVFIHPLPPSFISERLKSATNKPTKHPLGRSPLHSIQDQTWHPIRISHWAQPKKGFFAKEREETKISFVEKGCHVYGQTDIIVITLRTSSFEEASQHQSSKHAASTVGQTSLHLRG